MSSVEVNHDDYFVCNSDDSNINFENVIKKLEQLGECDLDELKKTLDDELNCNFNLTASENSIGSINDSQGSKKSQNSLVKAVNNLHKSSSNWSYGTKCLSCKSLSFKDVSIDDQTIMNQDVSGKGDVPNYEKIDQLMTQRQNAKVHNETEKSNNLKSDSYQSLFNESDFDDTAISKTLLSLLDEKNKYITHLQNKIHNQKIQLQYYLQKNLSRSKIKQLSQTCNPYLMEDNIHLNIAMKKFCKREGCKTTLMYLHDHILQAESSIYESLDNQNFLLEEIVQNLEKSDQKHASSEVMRSMSRRLGNANNYDILEKVFFGLLKLRKDVFMFSNFCNRILNIEEGRNRIVEQVYSLPSDQRFNCNVIANIQYEKFKLEEEFDQIKEEQKRIEDKLFLGENLEKYFQQLTYEGVINYPLQQCKINDYLERQMKITNLDELALLTIVYTQKAQFNQELQETFRKNQKLLEKVEQLQKAVQERDELLRKYICRNKKQDLKFQNSEHSYSNSNDFKYDKEEEDSFNELEEKLNDTDKEINESNLFDNGSEFQLDLCGRSKDQNKINVCENINSGSFRYVNNYSHFIYSGLNQTWQYQNQNVHLEQNIKDILKQNEQYLEEIKDLNKALHSQEFQIKNLLVIIDKLRLTFETKNVSVESTSQKINESICNFVQTDESIKALTDVKEAEIQTNNWMAIDKSEEPGSDILNVMDVLKECAENVKTVFGSKSSEIVLLTQKDENFFETIDKTGFGRKISNFPCSKTAMTNIFTELNTNFIKDQNSKEIQLTSEKEFKGMEADQAVEETVIEETEEIFSNFNINSSSETYMEGNEEHNCRASDQILYNSFCDNSVPSCEKTSSKLDPNVENLTESNLELTEISWDHLSTVHEQNAEESTNKADLSSLQEVDYLEQEKNPKDTEKDAESMGEKNIIKMEKHNVSKVSIKKSQTGNAKKTKTETSNSYTVKYKNNLSLSQNSNRSHGPIESNESIKKNEDHLKSESFQNSSEELDNFLGQIRKSLNNLNESQDFSKLILAPEEKIKSEKTKEIVETEKNSEYVNIDENKTKVNINSNSNISLPPLSEVDKKSVAEMAVNNEKFGTDEPEQLQNKTAEIPTVKLIPEMLCTYSKEIKSNSQKCFFEGNTFSSDRIKSNSKFKDNRILHCTNFCNIRSKSNYGLPQGNTSNKLKVNLKGESSLIVSVSEDTLYLNKKQNLSTKSSNKDNNLRSEKEKSLILTSENKMTDLNSSQSSGSTRTATSLRVETTDEEGKLQEINATFESTAELRGVIEVDENAVVHVILKCGSLHDDEINILSDKCDERATEKHYFSIKPENDSTHEIDSDCSKFSRITELLNEIMVDIDNKLSTVEGQKQFLESLKYLCRLSFSNKKFFRSH